MFCPRCGTQHASEDRFCAACGRMLAPPAPPPVVEPVAVATPAPPAPEPIAPPEPAAPPEPKVAAPAWRRRPLPWEEGFDEGRFHDPWERQRRQRTARETVGSSLLVAGFILLLVAVVLAHGATAPGAAAASPVLGLKAILPSNSCLVEADLDVLRERYVLQRAIARQAERAGDLTRWGAAVDGVAGALRELDTFVAPVSIESAIAFGQAAELAQTGADAIRAGVSYRQEVVDAVVDRASEFLGDVPLC